jgi:hypothetical protein
MMKAKTPMTAPKMGPRWLRPLVAALDTASELFAEAEPAGVPLPADEETAPEPVSVDEPDADPIGTGSIVEVEFVLLTVTVTADVPEPITTTDVEGSEGMKADVILDPAPAPVPPLPLVGVADTGCEAPIAPPTELSAEAPF